MSFASGFHVYCVLLVTLTLPLPCLLLLVPLPRHTDVANKSMRLAQESKKYAAQARHANRMRLVRQYVPLGVVGLVVLAALVWVVRSRG